MISAILLDIEGTIGDIAFVRDVLFPYSRARVAASLASGWHNPDIASIVANARQASGLPLANPADATQLFLAWIAEDRKVTPLKALQGTIWREGYASGELKAHLYPDAIDAIRRWSATRKICIYSSGSVEAQKLYLAHSIAGDLSPHVSGYFDTTTGPKAETQSYSLIAAAIGQDPSAIAFFSDAAAETQAAHKAGFRTFGIDRSKPATFEDASSAIPLLGSFLPVADF